MKEYQLKGLKKFLKTKEGKKICNRIKEQTLKQLNENENNKNQN